MNNRTDVKLMIKRREDGVYDIYLNDTWVDSKGSAASAAKRAEELLVEQL
jgi:hypothetical protein